MTDNEINQVKLAELTGVHQSQISRILNSKTKSVSKNLRKICEYAKIQINEVNDSEIDFSKNGELMSAISEVCNGSERKANALARIIRSLGDFA